MSETSASSTVDSRICITCGVNLVGAFAPQVSLSRFLSAGSEDQDEEELTVTALAWICPGCGLVHWYAEEQHLDSLLDAATNAEALTGEPGQSYERRTHMLRMLRRVRRM